MSFNDRIQLMRIAVDMFDAWCIQHNLIVGKSGYESWGDDKFKARIRQLDDITARRIRFFPDRTILGAKGAQLTEIKNSTTIEKDAWETYMDLWRTGYHVGIVFRNEEQLSSVKSEEPLVLVYRKNPTIVRLLYTEINDLQIKMPDKKYLCKYGVELPIDKDGWIIPRNLPQEQYMEWKSKSNGSGTAYGLIDFVKTKWKILWDEVEDGDLGVEIRKVS